MASDRWNVHPSRRAGPGRRPCAPGLKRARFQVWLNDEEVAAIIEARGHGFDHRGGSVYFREALLDSCVERKKREA